MTAYRVTYSTKPASEKQYSTIIMVKADDVLSAVATANAQMIEVWPDWLRELHFISAVVPTAELP